MGKPTSLMEGKNVFRGFSSDYAKAKITFKQFREGRLYELKKQFSGQQLLEQIQQFDKRNLAYFEGKIDNVDLDSNDIKISGSKYEGEPIFDAYKVDKDGGVGTEGAWSREFDTEYVGLSEIARKLGGKKGQKFHNVKGQITIASELPYCISCQGVIQDFATMFPNVKVYLVDGIKAIK
ncbi:deaminase domain-containing protein [Flavobacterium oreochromis]